MKILSTRVLQPELHADFFGRRASPLDDYILVAVDERGEDVLCPTRFVVDATKNSKGGGVDKGKGEPKLGKR